MPRKLPPLTRRLRAALQSKSGRDIMLYLMFCAVAFFFWLFLSLDTEVMRDFDIPVEITDLPDSVTVIGQVPPAINVSVKAKDSHLLKFMWGKMSPIKLKWAENSTDSHLFLSRAKLDGRIREYFGPGISVVTTRPDSIFIPYTTDPGLKVRLDIDADIQTNLQYIISGPIKANVDSVTLYSNADIPHSLRYVATEPIIRTGLRDTARYEVKVKPIAGVRIIPDHVTVTVPVEPLISKKRIIPIEVTELPEGKRLLTFPNRIEMTYLVPISAYGDDYPVRATVRYTDTALPGNKIPVSVSLTPDIYRNVSFTPQMVDYIIENND